MKKRIVAMGDGLWDLFPDGPPFWWSHRQLRLPLCPFGGKCEHGQWSGEG